MIGIWSSDSSLIRQEETRNLLQALDFYYSTKNRRKLLDPLIPSGSLRRHGQRDVRSLLCKSLLCNILEENSHM